MCVLCWGELYRQGCPCGRDSCPKWNGEWHAPCGVFYRNSCFSDSFLERQGRKTDKGKSRRIALIRDVWLLPRDSELAYAIHSIYFGQRSIYHEAARNRNLDSHSVTGSGSTQTRLSLID